MNKDLLMESMTSQFAGSTAPRTQNGARDSRQETIIGMVTDQRMWRMAAVLMQMLQDVNTSLPLVVFNSSPLTKEAIHSLRALGGRLQSLRPAMPMANGLQYHIRRGNGGIPAWAKLALWSQGDTHAWHPGVVCMPELGPLPDLAFSTVRSYRHD